jgi:hypothetical protein
MSIRGVGALIAIAAIFAVWSPAQAAPAGKAEQPSAASVTDLSAQTRRVVRRRPARITVRPVRPLPLPRNGDLSNYKRACVPVFEQRWIPQWGGRVLYASQRCRWVRDW